MSKKENAEKKKKYRGRDLWGRIFAGVLAGILAIMMIAGFAATLIFNLIG